jgi:hypothetical protein
MQPRILLLNPPAYDFSAYDFWLKPYGLLTVGGWLRGQAELRLFDFLDRRDPRVPAGARKLKSDAWGRGEFFSRPVEKPALFADIPRRYHRFGLPREAFQEFLKQEPLFDFVFIQTGLTYWYPGVKEVLADLRDLAPRARVALGGVYATLCPAHAQTLGADLVVSGTNLEPLWKLAGLSPRLQEPPFWEGYGALDAGVLKLTDGCPFKCTYCVVPRLQPEFHARPLARALQETMQLAQHGVQNIAFYDDALLFQASQILSPFLNEISARRLNFNFHTPNAVNARFVTRDLARAMVAGGFKLIYLGFESTASGWQRETGGKVYADELANAVENLAQAGALPRQLCAYLILGHPRAREQELEASLRYAHSLGIRCMLAEFSPLPQTADGELCRRQTDLDEPLNHNKTAWAIRALGAAEVSRLKLLCKKLNQS